MKGRPLLASMTNRGACGITYVEEEHIVPHVIQRGRASLRILLRRYGLIPDEETTSTGRRSAWENDRFKAAISVSVRPRFIVTRTSTSLVGRASPLATEPKSLTSFAPCSWASFRRVARFARTVRAIRVAGLGWDVIILLW